MSYLSLLGLIFVLHLLAVSSPGPDFLLVIRNTMQSGKKAGSYTSLGIALGIAVHILYSLTGIALLLKNNLGAFKTVKYLGAAYIIYLGIKTLQKKTQKLSVDFDDENVLSNNFNPVEMIKTGFLTNILNPKASLFFLSIFSVMIPPDTPVYILTIIIIMMFLTNYFWFYIVAHIFSRSKMIHYYNKYEKVLQKAFGIILLLIGVEIFLF